MADGPGWGRPGWAPVEVDPTRPSVARVYDFFLGGSHNFASDRAFARDVLAILPGNVHEAARADARIVYVDHDPVAVTHSRQLLAGRDRATAILGDLRKPADVLADPELLARLDLGRPVVVLLVSVLHFVPDTDHPAEIIGQYLDALVPGSCLVISHATTEGSPGAAEVMDLYNRSASVEVMRMRSECEVAGLFGDLDLLDPGVVRIPRWRPDHAEDVPADVDTYPGFAGVGRRA